MRNRDCLVIATAVVFASSCDAQQFSITPNGPTSATSTNGWFSITALPATLGQPTSLTANASFRPISQSALGNTNADVLQSVIWYYRRHGASENNTPFRAPLSNPSSIFIPPTNGSGPTSGFEYRVPTTQSGLGGSFTSRQLYTIVAGNDGPTTTYASTITNTSQAAMDIELFCVVKASGQNFSHWYNGVHDGRPGMIVQNTSAEPDTFFRVWGDNFTHYDFWYGLGDFYPTFPPRANLGDSPAPGSEVFFPAGIAAFQWTLHLEPGANQTVTGGIGFIPTPGAGVLIASIGGVIGARASRRR